MKKILIVLFLIVTSVTISFFISLKTEKTASAWDVWTADKFEINDSFDTAKPASSDIQATIHHMFDQDYYYFVVDKASSSVNIQLKNIPAGTDYDIVLYDSNKRLVTGSYKGGVSNEYINRTLYKGTYYIKIYSYKGCSDSSYLLQIDGISNLVGNLPNDLGILGYGIDIVLGSGNIYDQLKLENQIFTNYYRNILALDMETIEPRSSITKITSGSSFENYHKSLSSNLNQSIGLNGIKGLWAAEAELGFSLNNNISSEKFYSQYTHKHEFEYVKKISAIKNFNNREYDYYGYDRSFINLLHEIKSLKGSTVFYGLCLSLFQKYGTHIIGKAKYGAKSESLYSVTSNYVDFNSTIEGHFNSKINLTYANIVGGSGGYDISLGGEYNLRSEDLQSQMRVSTIGGSPFSATNFASFNNSFPKWVNSIEGREAWIGFHEHNALVPIWEILPPTYTDLKNDLENAFKDYVEWKYNDAIISSKNSNIPSEKEGEAVIRTYKMRISDNSDFKQGNDYFNLQRVVGLDARQLKNLGYKQFSIEVELDMKIINDGNQHIRVYALKSNGFTCIADIKYNVGKSYTKRMFVISNLYLRDYTSDNIDFKIGYDASGKFSDDWENKNVKVTITVKK